MRETTYHNVLMGRLTSEDRVRHTVIMPNIPRATTKRKATMVRELAKYAGRTIAELSDAELARHFTKFAGRYSHVTITEYGDGTYSYSTPTSGGGNHSVETLHILQ